METITLADFQARCIGILETVNHDNQPVLISHHGLPLVKILPVTSSWLGCMANTGEITGDIVSPLDSTLSEWQVYQ